MKREKAQGKKAQPKAEARRGAAAATGVKGSLRGPVVLLLKLRRRRNAWLALCGLLLLLCLVAVLSHPRQSHQLSAAQQAAVAQSRQKAKVTINQKDYAFSQLGQAINLAVNHKCAEARAVYTDASGRQSGFSAAYFANVQQRIEDICSGKDVAAGNSDTE